METADSVGFMRPLFSTMGVAALEYPGEHILRPPPCGSSRARSSAGATRSTPEKINDALRMLGGNDFDEQLLQRLTEGSDRVSVALFQETFKPTRRASRRRSSRSGSCCAMWTAAWRR